MKRKNTFHVKVEWIKKGEKLKLTFKDKPSFANLLRRYLSNGVEVPAVDEVVFYENTSSFFDEYIAHRIGMLPLKDNGKKEGFLYLDFSGPGFIYSKDLSGDFEVSIEDIPIVSLLEDQRIRLKAIVRRGKGRKHAKFQAMFVNYIEKDDGSIEMFLEDIGNGELLNYTIKGLKEIKEDIKRLRQLVENIEK